MNQRQLPLSINPLFECAVSEGFAASKIELCYAKRVTRLKMKTSFKHFNAICRLTNREFGVLVPCSSALGICRDSREQPKLKLAVALKPLTPRAP